MITALENKLDAAVEDSPTAEYEDDDIYFVNDAKILPTMLYGLAPFPRTV